MPVEDGRVKEMDSTPGHPDKNVPCRTSRLASDQGILRQ